MGKSQLGFWHRRMRPWAPLFLAAACTGAAGMLTADTVVLKNGETLEGRIVSQSDEVVVFQDMSRVVLRLRMDQIQSLEQGLSALNLEELGDRALAGKQFEEAVEHFTAAIEKKADRRRIDPKLSEARRQIAMRDLGMHAQEIEQVRRHIDSGNLTAAQRQIDQLRTVDPDDEALSRTLPLLQSTICYRQALQYLDSVNYSEADKRLRQALDFDPENANACLELARITAQIARTREEAVLFYKQAIKSAQSRLSEEEVFDAKYSLARLYSTLGKHEDASTYFMQVFEASPGYKSDLTELLVSSLQTLARENEIRNPRKSVEAYRKALEVRPYDASIRANLAASLVSVGEYDEAIQQYQQILQTDLSFPNLHQKFAIAYREKGEYQKASEQLRLEIERNPRHYSALVDLGDILVRMGDFDQAREYYLKARAIDSLDPRATVSLAMAERLLGNYSEARKYAQHILDIRPDDPRVVLEMGLINKDDKKLDEALPYLERTMKLIEGGGEDDKLLYRKLLADAYIASGEVKLLTRGPATATEDFNKALQAYPNYPNAYFNVGAAYQKKYSSTKLMEDLVNAEQSMKKARELEPNNSEFAYGLGVLYHQVLASADPANQKSHLEKALENYRAYIINGGAEVTRVEAWIAELDK